MPFAEPGGPVVRTGLCCGVAGFGWLMPRDLEHDVLAEVNEVAKTAATQVSCGE